MKDEPVDESVEATTSSHTIGGIERELFGKWTIMLRNIGGITAILTMCITSILNSYTTHLSVADKGIWPSEITLLITNVGLVVVAWTWVNANKTIATIIGGTNLTDRIRNRVAGIISTEKKPEPPPDADTRNS